MTDLKSARAAPTLSDTVSAERRELIEFALNYPTDTLDASDAAKLLGRTETQLKYWRRSGKGPSYLGGGGYPVLYRAGPLLAWVAADLSPPPGQGVRIG